MEKLKLNECKYIIKSRVPSKLIFPTTKEVISKCLKVCKIIDINDAFYLCKH